MQTLYDGAHSIIFGNKHTWDDWKLVPASMPTVAMPEVNTNMIEIPGTNGILDLTEVPLGYSTFKQRTGSWDFKIAHDMTDYSWAETYSMVAAYLHGRKQKCTLVDDRTYYYTGRFKLNALKSDKLCNTITIEYELNPYKEMQWTTCGDWLWDPFDFVHGVINQADYKDIVIVAGSNNTHVWNQNYVGSKPVTPKITVASRNGTGMDFIYANSVQGLTGQSVHLADGENTNPLIEFVCPSPDDNVTFSVIGEGTMSIDFRLGRL